MKSLGIGKSRVALLATCAVAVALGYVDGHLPTSGAGAQPRGEIAEERAPQAGEAEAAIRRANLVARLETALGGGFGGVWFDPSTPSLHVGVISPESYGLAERVAENAGLPEVLTPTYVDDTWIQLEAAQARWNRRLAALPAPGAVGTSLAADENSVLVEVGPSVRGELLAALEREAAAAEVGASLKIRPNFRLGLVPWERCAKHAEQFKAYCDPTIVAGVSIDDETEKEKKGDCTAGPAVIYQVPESKAEATATFLLTAGHCTQGSGGIGKKWYAFEKSTARKEIGQAEQQLVKEPGVGVDAGVIKVETGTWAKAKDPIPVVPTIANWSATKETDPFPVTGNGGEPVKGEETCFSGQRSGVQCGKVVLTGHTIQVKDKDEKVIEEVKEIAVVELTTGKGGKGDSGAPAYAKAEYDKSEGLVQGIVIGGPADESEYAYVQPLSFILPELNNQKALNLRLLAEENEVRHGQVEADEFPVTIDGEASGVELFTTEAGSVECEVGVYHAVAVEKSPTLTVAPEYDECEAFEGLVSATIDMEECVYVFHVSEKVEAGNFRATADISCPEGQSMKIQAPFCKAEVGSQSELETVDLVNDASEMEDITVLPTLSGIAYTVTEDGFLCPFEGTGEKSDGEYTSTSSITATGQEPGEGSESIDIRITGE